MKKLSLVLFVALFFAFPVFAQTDVQTIIERAKKLVSEDKTEEAIAEIGKAAVIEPNNADVYLWRAEIYFRLQNKPEILKDAQKAASVAPTDKKVLYRAALVLERSQQHQEALLISDQLMALGNVDSIGWGLRVQIKTALRDFIGAFEDATTAIELFPEVDYLKQNQANLIRLLGDSDKALKMYDVLVAATEKKLANAKDENEKISIKRSLSMFFFSRADLNIAKFSREQGFADLDKAVEYLPEPYSYLRRARVYRQQKMYAEAIADLTKALENKKQFDNIMLLIERGDVYVYMEKYDEAVKDYDEALKLDSKIQKIYDTRIARINKMRAKNLNQPK